MKRYVTTGGTFFTEWGLASSADFVIEKDRKVKKTGLLDASGNDIFSVEETGPIGFVPLRNRSKN
jgi:hypothetical protein